jgi:(1->4)-alpha-D-glucan 1-alpha-D-glucosylmutase
MMRGALLSGVTMLAHELKRVADASWTTRDISLNSLHEALVEFIAAMPVYRTYLGTGQDRDTERQIVVESLELAELRNPSMDSSAFAFLRSLLLGELVDDPMLDARRALLVKRLQQYTSGVHAKGVEDTAFYRDNTLLALNEVGGNPADPSLNIREFHRFNEHRAKNWPNSMTATSTHDTKVSEDTRIRMATISVFAHEWVIAAQRWVTLNTPYRQQRAGRGSCPEPRDEYRFYQALVGMWNEDDVDAESRVSPELVERLVEYMRKSVREAQLCSSWIRPDAKYEDGLTCFVRRVLLDDACSEFPAINRGIRATDRTGQQLSLNLTAGAEMLHAGRAGLLSGLRGLAIHAHRSRQSSSGGLRPRFGTSHPHLSVVAQLPRFETADHDHAATLSRRSRSAVTRGQLPAVASTRREGNVGGGI